MKSLADALELLDEKEVLKQVEALKQESVPALDIIRDLQEGMRSVGKRFESGEYFLSELIMSAEIFKSAIGLLKDALLENAVEPEHGSLVLGTVAGDIHDVGKNIVGAILGCNGFDVVDLGVNVPPDRFVQSIREHRPKIVGLSCLLTTAFDGMLKTVKAIEEAGLRDEIRIVIGGAPVTQATCDYVGADAFCVNANTAVQTAKTLVGEVK